MTTEPSSGGVPSAHVGGRYGQCDETCTVDCGHCKGGGRPVEPVPDTEAVETPSRWRKKPVEVEAMRVTVDGAGWPSAVVTAWCGGRGIYDELGARIAIHTLEGGICWRMLTERQEAARKLLSADIPQDAPADEQSHCFYSHCEIHDDGLTCHECGRENCLWYCGWVRGVEDYRHKIGPMGSFAVRTYRLLAETCDGPLVRT